MSKDKSEDVLILYPGVNIDSSMLFHKTKIMLISLVSKDKDKYNMVEGGR
uniref:Uncharacterized protein n=1 Tax=Arundo donax TaxID=35708 RepID=A0A0A9HFK0_ARUDO